MNSDYLIKLEDAAIGYDKKGILDSINLSIEQGQFWGIIGPNGGGKTTLLKTVSGLILPVAGKVDYGKKIILGYVPQRDNFDPIFPISVAELVAMGRYSRIPFGKSVKEQDRKVVGECLERVEISHLRKRPLRSLSGGEKQRALLARSLAGEPDLLVLDEPTASMDVKGETTIMELVGKIKEEKQLTVLMVSHFLNTVSRFADHVVVVDKDKGVFHAGTKEGVFGSKNLSEIFGMDVALEPVTGRMRIHATVGAE